MMWVGMVGGGHYLFACVGSWREDTARDMQVKLTGI